MAGYGRLYTVLMRLAGRLVCDADAGDDVLVVTKRYRDLGRACTQVACRLHAVLCELIPGGVPKEITAAHAASPGRTPAGHRPGGSRWADPAGFGLSHKSCGSRPRRGRRLTWSRTGLMRWLRACWPLHRGHGSRSC